MERRFLSRATCPVKVEKRDGDLDTLFGYASVFYDPGVRGTEFQLYNDLVERIMPTAFDRALREGQAVKCLFNHDPNCLLGATDSKTMTLKCDTRGLVYETVPGDTSIARDVCQHVARGDCSGSSFSFSVVKQAFITMEDMDVREIHDVDLYDCGPVTFPAYDATSAGVRSRNDLFTIPEEVRAEYLAWKEVQKRAKKTFVGTGATAARARARVVEMQMAG